MRIVVAGARGQLGAAVVYECSGAHDVVELGHDDLDVTDEMAVRAAMDHLEPEAIINCAGYNDVDGAEDHPVEALNANAFAVRSLARAAADAGATLVHYSSDFVFDGTKPTPYTEEDRPNPRSVYATSKLLGEWFAREAPGAYVLRVESLFGRAPHARPAKGSAAGLLQAVVAHKEVRVFVDRTVTPTYIFDAAKATRALLEGGAEPGLYHCVNSDPCTWVEFVQEIGLQLGIEPDFDLVRLEDLKLRAPRPRYSALSNAKLASVGVTMPAWRDAVRRYLHEVADDIAHDPADRQA
jgi:dTDP-4-dehydrorhamnose reductase